MASDSLAHATAAVELEGREDASIDEPQRYTSVSDGKKRLWRCQCLHGRTAETTKLLEAYRSAQKEGPRSKLVIIKGSTGTGKTALAKSLQEPICRDRGHMMTWKFDKQSMLQVVPGLNACLQSMFDDILSRSEKEIDMIRLRLRTQFDAVQIASFISLYRRLGKLFNVKGDQLPPKEKAYRNCWSNLRKLATAVCSLEFPVVYLFDDFQYIDDISLSWYLHGPLNANVNGALHVVTYNSDLEDVSSKWYKKLQSFRQNESIDIVDISTDNLDEHGTNSMVTEILGLHTETTIAIAKWVNRQSRGNPLYIEELLLRMCQNGVLHDATNDNSWKFDEAEAQKRWNGLGDVCEFLTCELQRYPEPLQEVLKVAASLGCRFKPEIVASAVSGPVFEYVADAKQSHVLLDAASSCNDQNLCCFVHNAMHEASLALVGDSYDRETLHVEIGRKLVQVLSDNELKKDLLTVTGQVMYGANRISSNKGNYTFARLAFAATQTLVRFSSFKSAEKTVSFAINLLENNSWRKEYDLTLALHNAAAEIAYANGQFKAMEEMANVVQMNARSFEDKLQANATRLYMLGSTNQTDEAFALGLAVLKELGETFPRKLSRSQVAISLIKTRWSLRGKSDESLLRLQTMNNSQKVAAMQIMNIMFSTAYVARPMLAPLLALRMVNLSLTHGLCAISAVAFSVYGMLLCSRGAHVTEGTNAGNLALKILDRFQSKQWVPRVYAAVYGFIDCWKKPIHIVFPHLLHGYRVALETGDMVFAVINAMIYIFYSFDSGKPVAQVEMERRALMDNVTSRHQQVPNVFQSTVVLLHEVLGKDTSAFRESADDGFGWGYHQMAIVSYVHRDYKASVEHGKNSKEVARLEGVDFALVFLVEGLASLALFKETGRRHRRLLSVAKRHIANLDRFTKHAMEYCLGRLLLLQAEFCSLSRRQHHDAIRKYTSAIALANARNSLFDEAIAHECYGRYLEERGNNMDSLSHLRKACSLFLEWNAYRKVGMLRNEIDEKAEALDANRALGSQLNRGVGMRNL